MKEGFSMNVTFIDAASNKVVGHTTRWDSFHGYGLQRDDIIETEVFQTWETFGHGDRMVLKVEGKKFVDASEKGYQPDLYLSVLVLDEPLATK